MAEDLGGRCRGMAQPPNNPGGQTEKLEARQQTPRASGPWRRTRGVKTPERVVSDEKAVRNRDSGKHEPILAQEQTIEPTGRDTGEERKSNPRLERPEEVRWPFYCRRPGRSAVGGTRPCSNG